PTVGEQESGEEDQSAKSEASEPKRTGAVCTDSASPHIKLASYQELDFDYDYSPYQMESTAQMPKFTHEHLPAFRAAAHRAMSHLRGRFRYQRGQVPLEDAIDLLDGFPTPETPFYTWHKAFMRDAKDNATRWLRDKSGKPDAQLDGESMLEYYLERLDSHFEPQRRNAKLIQYSRLRQDDMSPTSYLQ
ncbi:hypothetical protein Vretifemale_13607, partial [Volvox reticuliferus]